MVNDSFFNQILAEHDIEPLVPEIESAPKVTPEEEFVPPPRIQTPHKENSDPTTFKVGTWERDRGSWIRLALPHPRWAEPGAVATPEVARVYDTECAVALDAEIVMRQYLWYIKFQVVYCDYHNEASHQLAAQRIAWLRGLWNAKNIRCPREDEFEKMALESPPG